MSIASKRGNHFVPLVFFIFVWWLLLGSVYAAPPPTPSPSGFSGLRWVVANGNSTPKITSSAPTQAKEDDFYIYTPKVSDADTGDTHTWTLVKSAPEMSFDSFSGRIFWRPGDRYAGLSYDMELKVCDKAGACATQTWKITVQNVNDKPRILSLPSTVATEGKLYEYRPQMIDPDRNDKHTWSFKTAPKGMTVDATSGEVNWTPTNNQSEQQLTVELLLCDKAGDCDQQTWKVFVRNINDSPKITSSLPPARAVEDKVYSLQPVVVDPDPNETLTWQLVKGSPRASLDRKSGELTWTPTDEDTRSTIDFEWQVCDKSGACDSQKWTVTVQQVNDVPVILSKPGTSVRQGARYSYSPTWEDPDLKDSHVWTLKKGPSAATFSRSSGALLWTPSATDVNKTFDLEVEVCDKAGACATQAWKLNVQNVNDPPHFTSSPPTTAREEELYDYRVTFVDLDPNDSHTWTLKQAPKGASFDATLRLLRWKPTQAQTGKSYTFELEVCDKAKTCDAQVWKVTASNVNDAPRFTTVAGTTATEDKPYRYNPKIVDEDPGDVHTWALKQGPAGSNLLFDKRTGILEWLPGDKEAGKTIAFELQVCDRDGVCDTQNWQVKVTNINDQPRITTKPSTNVREEKLYVYTAKATDPDPNETLTWSMAFVPDGFKFDAQKAEVRWTPRKSDAGKVYQLELVVCDKARACALQSWKLTVDNVNNAPRLKGTLPAVAFVKERLLIQFQVEDDDPFDTHEWKLLKGPTGVSFPANSGRFTWIPAQSDLGRVILFELQVCDNGKPKQCDKKSFQVTIQQRCKVDFNCTKGYICEKLRCIKAECDTLSPCHVKDHFCAHGRCKSNPCAATQCKAGLVCEPISGLCIPLCDPSKCKLGERCVDGKCTSTACSIHPCKSGEVCDDWTEPANPTCTKNPCQPGSCTSGRFCGEKGQCVDDLCAVIRCPQSTPRCVKNQCLPALGCKVDRDCPGEEICNNLRCQKPTCTAQKDCEVGLLCIKGLCLSDPCLDEKGNPKCTKPGEYCRRTDGLCVKACADVQCPAGQQCVDGKCFQDLCGGLTCPIGQVCQSGLCVPDTCQGKELCKHGRVCSPSSNQCGDDPCAGVKCPSKQQLCRDGQCLSPDLCDLDSQCSNNLLCINRRCQTPLCWKNEDCKNGASCLGGECRVDLCQGKTCPKGQFCYAGRCRLSCAGIFCLKDEVCVDGKCRANPCADVECDGLKVCVNGRCKPELCGHQSCKAGRSCVLDRCVMAACDLITCPKGQTCKKGECTGELTCSLDADCPGTSICLDGKCKPPTCSLTGCPDGQICVNGECKVNPCRRRKCRDGEFCSPDDGRCLLIAERCEKGERFVDGRCEKDLCDGVSCKANQRCDNGTCVDDRCVLPDNQNSCKFNRSCFRDKCRRDPCEQVVCTGTAVCREGYCYYQPQSEVITPDGGILPSDEDNTVDAGEPDLMDGKPSEQKTDTVDKPGCDCSSTGGSSSLFFPLSFLLLLWIRRRYRLSS